MSIKRAYRATTITAVCVGALADRHVFKRVLALGADDAVLIRHTSASALNTAALIRRLVTLESYELVLLSNSSSDNGSGQTAPAAASLLGWAHLSNVIKLVGLCGRLHALCLLDRGRAWFEINLPCVIACNAKIAAPKLVSLSELVAAKPKQIRLKSVVGRRTSADLTAFKYKSAVTTRACKIITGVANTLETALACLEPIC